MNECTSSCLIEDVEEWWRKDRDRCYKIHSHVVDFPKNSVVGQLRLILTGTGSLSFNPRDPDDIKASPQAVFTHPWAGSLYVNGIMVSVKAGE